MQISNSTIYGYSFNDANSNKTKDKGESGLSNWVINLKGYDTCTGTLVSKLLKTYTIAVPSYSMNIRRDFGNKKLI